MFKCISQNRQYNTYETFENIISQDFFWMKPHNMISYDIVRMARKRVKARNQRKWGTFVNNGGNGGQVCRGIIKTYKNIPSKETIRLW